MGQSILEPGKLADFIVHEENPLKDLRILNNKESLLLVVKNGQVAASKAHNHWPKELFGNLSKL